MPLHASGRAISVVSGSTIAPRLERLETRIAFECSGRPSAEYFDGVVMMPTLAFSRSMPLRSHWSYFGQVGEVLIGFPRFFVLMPMLASAEADKISNVIVAWVAVLVMDNAATGYTTIGILPYDAVEELP